MEDFNLYAKARLLQDAQNYERAFFFYALVLFDDPANYDALYNRGFCKLQIGKRACSKELLTNAITDIEKAVSLAGARSRELPLARLYLEQANDELIRINGLTNISNH